jgi:hypothetical protein
MREYCNVPAFKQSGAVAKSYTWKGFLIYEERRKIFPYM